MVAAQAEVGKKTNEVPMAAVVLGQIDLEGKIVTADALHTVKATADHIHEHGGEFVLPVKENRRALFDALDALPWRDVPVAHTATDKGHGRITTRTIQVLPAPDDLPFPHVSQVFLIERYVTGLRGEPISAVAAAAASRFRHRRGKRADLARYVRQQWSIESLHWIRDTLYQEDKSQVANPRRTESWQLCATSRSGPSAWPDAPTSPKPPDGPDAPWTGPLPSSASHHDLGTAVLDGEGEIFGEPIFPDDAEYQDVRVLRDQLAGPGDQPTQHLGEAETIAIIIRRQLSCFLVSDDGSARRLAAQNGIQVVSTWHLLEVAYRAGLLDVDTFWGYVQTLRGRGRGAPPGVRDRSSFEKWLSI